MQAQKTYLAKVLAMRKFTAADLVRKAKVNETTVRGAIYGTRKPSPVNAAKIAKALGILPEDLFPTI